jgi:hypothetical protein
MPWHAALALSGVIHLAGMRKVRGPYRSGAKYCTTLIIGPANISVLKDLFACFIVPLIAVGRFEFIPPMFWTFHNL